MCSCRRKRVTNSCVRKLFAAHREALAAFRATPLEHKTSVFRAHSHEKTVRLTSMATIWLKCTLALHRFLSLQEARSEEFAPASPGFFEKTEPLMLANAFAECQRRKVCVRVGVLRLLPIRSLRTRMSVWSLTKVFHTCGKTCGNSGVSF